jgi:hypothetical protein
MSFRSAERAVITGEISQWFRALEPEPEQEEPAEG